jgi:hypothetical protein
MKARPVVAGLLLVLVALGCAAPAPTPPQPTPIRQSTAVPAGTTFSVAYETGSVPPPFNYRYAVDGRFQDGELAARYVLAYQFRDQLPPGKLPRGYSDRDDINWSTTLRGSTFDDWAALIATAELGPIPPLAPGSDSFTVTIKRNGIERTGVPANRPDWEAAIASLDAQARTETGNPRSEP